MGKEHKLDVRAVDIPQRFYDIMAKVEEVGPEDTLLLVNNFEPAPLYGELERRGYACQARQVAEGEWHITITRCP